MPITLDAFGNPVPGDPVQGAEYTVSDLAALRSFVTSPIHGEMATTLGRDFEGDGLGAWYRWVDYSVATDDGLNIIKPTAITQGRFFLFNDPSSAPVTSQNANNVTELRALTGVSGTIAILAGYSNPADGGGGVFTWETTAKVDNSGTRFNSAGHGSSAAGWRRIAQGPLSVQWFGAMSTATPSATLTAFDRALAEGVVSGRSVFVPAVAQGLFYRLASSLFIPTGFHGGRLFGENRQYVSSAVGRSMVAFDTGGIRMTDGAYGFSLSDLYIETVAPGFQVQNSGVQTVAYVTVERCDFYNSALDSEVILCGETGGTAGAQVTGITFDRCNIRGRASSKALCAFFSPAMSNTVIFGPNFNNCVLTSFEGATGPQILLRQLGAGDFACADIRNMTFENPSGGAVHIESVRHVRLSNVSSGDIEGTVNGPLFLVKASAAGTNIPGHIHIDQCLTGVGDVNYPTLKVIGNFIDVRVSESLIPWIDSNVSTVMLQGSTYYGHTGTIPAVLGGHVGGLACHQIAVRGNEGAGGMMFLIDQTVGQPKIGFWDVAQAGGVVQATIDGTNTGSVLRSILDALAERGDFIDGASAGTFGSPGAIHLSGTLLGSSVSATAVYCGLAGAMSSETPLRIPSTVRTARRMRIRLLENQTMAVTATITLMKNGSATTQAYTIPAAAALGTLYGDATQPIAFADGDDWDVKISAPTDSSNGTCAVSITLETLEVI